MLKIRINPDPLQRNLVPTAKTPPIPLHPRGNSRRRDGILIPMIRSQVTRRRLARRGVIGQAVERPAFLAAVGLGLEGGPGAGDGAQVRPTRLGHAGRVVGGAEHGALETHVLADEEDDGPEGGEAGGYDAGRHLDLGPADCRGEGVARIGGCVGEEDAEAVGGGEDHAIMFFVSNHDNW